MADRGLSRLARTAGAIPSPDPNTSTIRRLMGRKKPATYTPDVGGTKAPEDMVSAVMSMMQGSDAQRASLRQIFQEMPRDAKMRFLAEVAREFPRADGNPIGMSPQGEFVIDFLTGRAEMSPEQLSALQAVGREVATGEAVGPMQSAGGRGNTLDSGADGFVEADPDTPDVGGGITDPNDRLNRSSPRNPLRQKFDPQVEAGVLIDEVPHNPPLRSPNFDVNVENVGGQMKPVRVATDEGRLDTAGFAQKRQAEKGGRVRGATDAQAALGNANPQLEFERRLLDAAFGRTPSSDIFMGSGKNAGVWGQVKGPNAPADPRGAFQSPREFAEYLASRIRPDAILSRSSGMDTTGAMKLKGDLAGENVARYFEGKPEVSPAEADRLAREAGLPRTGQQRLEPGLDYVVDRLEQMARERFGDTWGDAYDDILQNGQQLTPDADIDVVPVADTGSGIEEVAEELPLVGSPEAIEKIDDTLMRLAENKADLPEGGDLTGQTFPSGRSLEEKVRPAKKTLTPEEAWERNQDIDVMAGDSPATERQIADARSASWKKNAPQAFNEMGGQLGLDEMPQSTPQQIRARMNELAESVRKKQDEISAFLQENPTGDAAVSARQQLDQLDLFLEQESQALTRQLLASQRLAPHVARKVNTIAGWKKEIGKAASAGDIARLEELGKQLKPILEKEGKAVGPTRDKLAKFYADKRDVAAKNYESGGKPKTPKPEPKRAPQEDLTPRPEDGAPPDEMLFRRDDEPDFSEPENLDELKDTVDPNEGLDGNLEAASKTEITPDDPPKQAEAASDAQKAQKSEEPAQEAATQATPEKSETPTDLILAEEPVLVGERIPGKQNSGRTVNGKVEKPKVDDEPPGKNFDKEASDRRRQEMHKQSEAKQAEFDKKNPPKKPKDGEAETAKTPEDGKKKGSLLKKGALVGGGLAAVVGAMALNRPGSARSVGQKIPLGGNPEGGGDGDGKELVAKVLGDGAGGAGSEDKSQARLIRMLQAAEKVRGFKVNPNTQTHMNWTR